MPSTNEPPETRKTTLYRLHEARGHPDELRKIIVPRYLDKEGFTAEPVTVGNVPALLVHGTISRGVTDWSAVLKKLTEAPVEETNSTAAAVLVIPVGESTYALSYGMGHLLIDPHFIDPGFGLSFAVRAVNPEKIKQVTRTAMLAQPRYERSSVPAGQNIRWYGVEEYGEIVGRITGQLADVELTFNRGRKRHISVAGTDSLKVHLATDPADLLDDLDLLGPNTEFIHVKAPTGSSELSHLFRQALTSYDALRYDPEAAEKLAERVNHARPGMAVPAQLTVIFAIALKDKKKGQPATYRPLTADTLFTFSQVSLVHTIRMFALAQVKVEVIDISRGIDPQTSARDR